MWPTNRSEKLIPATGCRSLTGRLASSRETGQFRKCAEIAIGRPLGSVE